MAEARTTAKIIDDRLSIRKRLQNWFLAKFWYVHPGAHLRVTITPSHTYRILKTAAKPSAKRLEYRKLFAQGRRYFLQETTEAQSFRMMTTHKIRWQMRRRTRSCALLNAEFETVDKDTFRIKLNSHIRIWYLVDMMIWPSFISSMIIYMWWPIWIITVLVLSLFTLSWLAHYFNAALEAHEMIYFIETILEDYFPILPPELPAGKADIVYEDAFGEAWEQYVGKMSEMSEE